MDKTDDRQTGQEGEGGRALDLSDASGVIVYQKGDKTYTVDLANPGQGNFKIGMHKTSAIDAVKMFRYLVIGQDLYKEPLNIGLQKGKIIQLFGCIGRVSKSGDLAVTEL